MRLFHVVQGDDIIGDRLGLVLRIHDSYRDFQVLLIVPMPGRWTTISDFYQRVILNARFNAWLAVGRNPREGITFDRGMDMRYEKQKDTGRKASVWSVLP